MELLQYFFVVLFVMYGYPFLFTKMKKNSFTVIHFILYNGNDYIVKEFLYEEIH